MVLALDTDNFLITAVINDDGAEFASFDAARVEAFGIFLDVETTLGVVPIYSYGALGGWVGVRLVVVPDLAQQSATHPDRHITLGDDTKGTYFLPWLPKARFRRNTAFQVNCPHVHDLERILFLQAHTRSKPGMHSHIILTSDPPDMQNDGAFLEPFDVIEAKLSRKSTVLVIAMGETLLTKIILSSGRIFIRAWKRQYTAMHRSIS
jgi:hypothetical protein